MPFSLSAQSLPLVCIPNGPVFARRPRLCPRVHFSRPSVCNSTGVCLCKRHIYAYLPCRNRPEKVALTFNCTYSAQDLHQLLEILKEKMCTPPFRFRHLGKNYPKLLCTIHNAGHDIGGLWTTQASLSIREQTLTLEISHSELIALPILKRRCFVLKTETMTTLLSGSSRKPAVIRCSGTSIPWTGKTTGHRTSSIGF